MSKSFLYERRGQYRLHYPVDERPRVTIEDIEYNIEELSEGGMKVLFQGDTTLPEEFPFTGLIQYIDGEEVEITGEMVRSFDHGFSVKFVKGVGARRIMSDQIRLKRKYPMLFDHVD